MMNKMVKAVANAFAVAAVFCVGMSMLFSMMDDFNASLGAGVVALLFFIAHAVTAAFQVENRSLKR